MRRRRGEPYGDRVPTGLRPLLTLTNPPGKTGESTRGTPRLPWPLHRRTPRPTLLIMVVVGLAGFGDRGANGRRGQPSMMPP
ncbi:MAG: hypothetical protein AVDCRST_MAG08-4261 [uncultured Acetobacteraceae bacterium]|uniref:Uncharacterized protein n=1 Tax=uncultured Acetobacteraceae bacterium TaxID=169975 RepID=A0A6J4JSR7_9PROT|nr:MAG: hypothetical protein AVDCRST_MAG08-4261 [uncultured Acetobacteraceae bacterium]